MAERIAYLQAFVILLKLRLHSQRHYMTALYITRRRRRRLRARRMALLNRMVRRPHAVWAHPRAQLWWDTVVPDFDSEQFLQNFRMSRESFDYICRRLRPSLQKRNTNFRLAIPVEKRVGIALWKLATNSEYRSVSHLFGVGIATACHCLQDFCNAVIKVLLPLHIALPNDRKLVEMADFFAHRRGTPQCVGAIDSSHIPIIAPEEYPQDYCNQKGWHSIILQGVVDGKGLFWDVCVGYPGSVHDARVLQQSYLWQVVSDGQFFSHHKVSISGHQVGHYLIGDAAYPLQTWLMKPFTDTGKLNAQQQRFNASLSSTRAVVETTFGKLKGRWRCLLKRNDCHLELTKKIALSCCVLHNICEEHGDQLLEDIQLQEQDKQPPAHISTDPREAEGAVVRTALSDYFNN
uniref:Protein ANTAGONIST OF LIKE HETEROCHROMATIN PROTEIN 1-like n=1 Tax=Paramormyrops kingsleyae TaxID=1676925 RepID=A0A3B3SJ36_9TELE|nr:protein ANTAGONIST OF LIKE HETEROCHROMATIN PROTEIN 1-like [Paramormyrops kingsleyae]XP_023697246.1 protein ANTAGONIST OF LIKE HETEROCHROMATIN PROTEIN 1-like [Paramormyrops kingsleyae]